MTTDSDARRPAPDAAPEPANDEALAAAPEASAAEPVLTEADVASLLHPAETPEPAAEPAPAEAVPVAEVAPPEPVGETAAAAETAMTSEPVERHTFAPAAPAPEAPAAAVMAAEPQDELAAEEAEEGDADGPSAKDEYVEIAKTIGYALLIALVLRVLLFQPFTIPSASMEPNLYEGDYIIVSKWNYGYSRYSLPIAMGGHGRVMGAPAKRGDIVVFKLPRDNKTDYIKRVIGLPGDRIQVRENQLYINDKIVPAASLGPIDVPTRYGFSRPATKLRETLPNGKQHLMQDFGPEGDLDNTNVYVVPQGYYFMMGDNRDDSIDSRVPSDYGVGYVPAENLVGKAQIILFSWTPGAKLYKPWTWFTHLRPSRFFTALK